MLSLYFAECLEMLSTHMKSQPNTLARCDLYGDELCGDQETLQGMQHNDHDVEADGLLRFSFGSSEESSSSGDEAGYDTGMENSDWLCNDDLGMGMGMGMDMGNGSHKLQFVEKAPRRRSSIGRVACRWNMTLSDAQELCRAFEQQQGEDSISCAC